jgi:hypothetical protein
MVPIGGAAHCKTPSWLHHLGAVFRHQRSRLFLPLADFLFGELWRRSGSAINGITDRHKELLLSSGRTHASIRAGVPDAFLKACGALAGMFTVDPARTVDVSPRKVNSSSPSSSVNISSKS